MTPKPTNPQDKDSHRSNCCNAPTVLCKGRAWDVKTVQKGSTYYYGCTKCHKACDIAGIVTEITDEPQDKDKAMRALVNRSVNEIETITYHKHHYVRKTGIKKLIKQLLAQQTKDAFRAGQLDCREAGDPTNHKYYNESLKGVVLPEKVDRFEVIDDEGRAYAKGSIYGSPVKVKLSLQDEGRTLKVFVKALNNKENTNEDQ